MPATIPVTCDPDGTLRRVPIETLAGFQQGLKSLSMSEYDQLYASLRRFGFFAPVFVWADHNLILDGHQRLFVCQDAQLEVEGGIPVVEIEAATEQEAAKKLLVISSTYGKISYEGLYEFSAKHGVNFREFQLADLPGIDMDEYLQHFTPEEIPDPEEGGEGEGGGPRLPTFDPGHIDVKVGQFRFQIASPAWEAFLARLEGSVGSTAAAQCAQVVKLLGFHS